MMWRVRPTPLSHATTLATVLMALPLAMAQPTGPAISAAPEQLPAASVATPEAALLALRAAYRAGPLAEKVTVRVTSPDGRTRTASLTLRLRSAQGDTPAQLRLELGRLIVWAKGTDFRAVTPANASLCVQQTLEATVSTAQLAQLMPTLPLPQLAWALDEPGEAVLSIGGGRLRWSDATLFDVEGSRVLHGQSDWGRVEIAIAKDTGRLARLVVPLAPSGGELELSIRPLDPGDEASWVLDCTNRERVGAITLLRGTPGDLEKGARIPALGLMDDMLEPWSLAQALSLPASSPRPDPARHAVLILYRPGQENAEEEAKTGYLAAETLKRAMDREALLNQGEPGLFLTRPVGVMELNEFTGSAVTAASARWNVPGASPPVWTSMGRAVMDRFVRGANAVLVVVDAEQRLVASIPLDGRVTDESKVAADLRAVLVGVPMPPAMPEPAAPEPATPEPAPK